jgi:site-specific DNA-methyltransferase (adenine-specific)
MSNSVENALKAVGDVLNAEIEAERARASIAENSMKALINGLRSLLNDLPRAANDVEENTSEPSEAVSIGCRRSAAADETFLSALTTDWTSAATLRKVLLATNVSIAEGTVYNRMRKLASERPHEIESASKPERWRLRSTRKGRKPSILRNKAEAKDAKTRGDRLSLVPSEQASSSFPTSQVHRPVLHHGDCLEVMRTLADDSVDLILADLPYGTTHLSIDERLNLDELWSEYRRILRKPHGNIVLFASQPFTTVLINAAPDIFRYSLVWHKNSSTGFQHAGSKPLKKHEDILVFSYGVNISGKRTKRRATYNDQQAVPIVRKAKGRTNVTYLKKAIRGYPAGHEYIGMKGCQTSILHFPKDSATTGEQVHPFAKPVALLDHLIRTYSHPGEVVLDNTMGSGSTCIAAMNAGRQSIGVEKNDDWYRVAVRRIQKAHDDLLPVVPIRPHFASVDGMAPPSLSMQAIAV